jgi:hypothetical protein
VPETPILLAALCLPNGNFSKPDLSDSFFSISRHPVLRSIFILSVDCTVRQRNNNFVFWLPIHQVAIRDIIWIPLLDLQQGLSKNSSEAFFESLRFSKEDAVILRHPSVGTGLLVALRPLLAPSVVLKMLSTSLGEIVSAEVGVALN